MHNHDEKDGSWMMWVMMICCAVPLLLIALFGLGGKAFGAPTWVVIGGVAVMVIAHFWMMSKKHKDHNEDSKSKDEHQHGDSCH
jgi:cell division protein FtsW (lipid II flippase)